MTAEPSRPSPAQMQRAPEGVRDERLAREAHLGAMALLGERERAPQGVAIDLRMALGDLPDELVQLRAAGAELEPEVRDLLRHM